VIFKEEDLQEGNFKISGIIIEETYRSIKEVDQT
jgi:hypothetical protein